MESPRFDLERLREIGWRDWDPLGLGPSEEPFEDEYDGYLLTAVGGLWNGAGLAWATDYLLGVEVKSMELEDVPAARDRANTVARALNAYVDTLR